MDDQYGDDSCDHRGGEAQRRDANVPSDRRLRRDHGSERGGHDREDREEDAHAEPDVGRD